MSFNKALRREKIRKRIRGKLSGTAERPRLCVFRSNAEMYVQLVDDTVGRTLATAATSDKSFARTGTKVEQSKNLGITIAKIAAEKNIATVVFDRGGFLYHGRVKALAEGAREGGLKF